MPATAAAEVADVRKANVPIDRLGIGGGPVEARCNHGIEQVFSLLVEDLAQASYASVLLVVAFPTAFDPVATQHLRAYGRHCRAAPDLVESLAVDVSEAQTGFATRRHMTIGRHVEVHPGCHAKRGIAVQKLRLALERYRRRLAGSVLPCSNSA